MQTGPLLVILLLALAAAPAQSLAQVRVQVTIDYFFNDKAQGIGDIGDCDALLEGFTCDVYFACGLASTLFGILFFDRAGACRFAHCSPRLHCRVYC